MPQFVHLHVHSQYSILDGQASIQRLVDKAMADGQPGIALTDHGNMFGVKEFFNYVKKAKGKCKDGIKVCEARIAGLRDGSIESADAAAEIAAEERKKAEWERKAFIQRCAEHGCGEDGVGYVLTGNTFSVKDEIKKAGGKWIYGRWICPVEIKGKGISARRIDISSHISTGMYGWKDDGFDFDEEVTA